MTEPSDFTASLELLEVLARGREHGYLGPGPVEDHVRHASVFVAGAPDGIRRGADLGSGGGVPGLILAERWPESSWMLVDRGARRAAFLRTSVSFLELDDRVEVVEGPAETAGRDERWRGSFDLVTARGFGPPAVTAECAAPFLRLDGHLVVSEPPLDSPSRASRWDPTGLELVGLRMGSVVEAGGASAQVFVQSEPCPDRYPRRAGVPGKRPLFS